MFTNYSFNSFRGISAKQEIATSIHSNRKVNFVNVLSFLFSDGYAGSN